MSDIFDFKNYREFVKQWVTGRPKKGHGYYRKIAFHLRIAPVTITQVFKGDRELPLEAALPLADFLELSSLERKYFVKLVQIARAGTPQLKQFLQDEADKIRTESQQLHTRIPSQVQLTEANLAIFHSSWVYSAVRLLTAVPHFQTPHALAEKLALPVDKVEEILLFLVSCGLCMLEDDHYEIGPSRTHLPESSPFIVSRQLGWRSRAAVRMTQTSAEELFYTAPMTLAHQDVPLVRKELIKMIERVNALVGPSKSEELTCLNIDWFKVAPE